MKSIITSSPAWETNLFSANSEYRIDSFKMPDYVVCYSFKDQLSKLYNIMLICKGDDTAEDTHERRPLTHSPIAYVTYEGVWL